MVLNQLDWAHRNRAPAFGARYFMVHVLQIYEMIVPLDIPNRL